MKNKLAYQFAISIIMVVLYGITGSEIYAENSVTEGQLWIKTTTNSLTIDWNGESTSENPMMNLIITKAGGEEIFWQGDIKGRKVGSVVRFQVSGLSPELWTPVSPNLYQLKFSINKVTKKIQDGEYRIGFNEFETKDGKLYLNGKPIFLRGIAINPPGRGIPGELEKSRDFALQYVGFLKSMNVNIIRIPDNENWYDVCDELGMMVFGGNYSGSVNGEKPPEDYEKGVNWYKNTKFQPVMHHPALVIYALTNEVSYRGESAQKWMDFLSYAHTQLKDWDSTRLYIGNAGYGYGQSGDICDLHRYWGWYYSSPYTFLHVRDYENITLPDKVQPLTFTECVGNYTGPDGRYNLTPNHKNPVSQLNWTGHAPQREQQLLADEHQSFVFKQVTELIRRLRRINPESSGVFPFTIMFRNWHTIRNFIDMSPKPVTRQARISYQPVLLSWENWQAQAYAGSTIQPFAHIVNDSEYFSDLKENRLVVRLLDKAFSVIFSDTLLLPDIPYFDIHSEIVKINIPENLFTGNYTLEGIVCSSGVEVSRNTTEIYISGTTNKNLSGVGIKVYDPEGKTTSSLKDLGFDVEKIDSEDISKELNVLVIGDNGVDQSLVSKRNVLKELLKNGGRILLLRQDENHQKFVNDILPVPLIFPQMDIDNPEYPPPPRPSRNSFNINPERPDHPVFSGISRNEMKVWSDYTGWDETKPGMPAIYPVTNGFVLKDKPDKENVAILANYSVGLEGIALAEIFEGEGSVLVSGFDLVNRTGLDPVADRLLLNLVNYCRSGEDHDIYPLIEAPVLWGEYETENGVLDGITSGFMINSKPKLTGSYEGLPILLEKEGHMYAGAKGGWNNRAGKQYVPYGRRIFGPYYHRDFGGIPTLLYPESETGEAYFWCRVPVGTSIMKTLIWNPAEESLEIEIGINNKSLPEVTIPSGEYIWIDSPVSDSDTSLKIDLEGDRRLVVLETRFLR